MLDTVQKYYKCSCDWKGERYCGLTIKWDYEKRKVHLSMPGYVKKALTCFQHPLPGKATGSTLPSCQTKLWGKKAILTRGRQRTSPQQGREKIHPRGLRSVPFPCKGSRWGTTPCPQLSRIPTGKPDRENNGALQTIFRFYGNTGRRCTHLPSKRHGPRNPQRRVVSL